ncbi:xaa-His dipeptidase [Oscillibacter sp. 1-3]|nr:xaa-His dipeptidase [Oscillibacter sp. 1-3]
MALSLEPQAVFSFFEEISAIPRGSGNEAAIAAHMISWASARNLFAERDSANNVFIKKAASPGKENHPPILLQAHLDMVCEKTPESAHDFQSDPISIQVRDGYLVADGTTLGADNGIGVSLIMAVLDDPNAEHPPLEVLFTAGEEAGMTGARQLSSSGWAFESKTLINLDSGWEGVFIAGAAGGGRTVFRIPIERESNADPCFRIDVRGLLGGHSGAEIHLGRANANQVLARVLNNLTAEWRLISMGGGGKDNAIARNAYAVLSCADISALHSQIAQQNDALRREYESVDPELEICITSSEPEALRMTSASTACVKQFLILLPNGVLARDHAMDFTVTSMNIGSCRVENDCLAVRCSVRSTIPAHLTSWLLPQLRILAGLCSAELEEADFYPGWEFRRASPIRTLAMEAYQAVTGSPASFKILHGGLECGILMEQLGFTDAISYGPELNDPHSPRENLSITSVGTADKLIRRILKAL